MRTEVLADLIMDMPSLNFEKRLHTICLALWYDDGSEVEYQDGAGVYGATIKKSISQNRREHLKFV